MSERDPLGLKGPSNQDALVHEAKMKRLQDAVIKHELDMPLWEKRERDKYLLDEGKRRDRGC